MSEHIPDQPEPFELIASYYTDDPVIDKFTHVFSETNPYNHGYYTMLATDNTGWGFSNWTEGQYEEGGDNSHLGNEVCLLATSGLYHHVQARMHEGDEL